MPVTADTDKDGSYALPVSPRRRYALIAHPPSESAFATTFIGSGPWEATDFVITQSLRIRRPWAARVVGVRPQSGVAGAAVSIYCHPDAVDCPDPTVPLAESATAPDGSFQVAVPQLSGD